MQETAHYLLINGTRFSFSGTCCCLHFSSNTHIPPFSPLVMLVPSVTINDTSCRMLKSTPASVSVHEFLRVSRQPATPVSSGSLASTNKVVHVHLYQLLTCVLSTLTSERKEDANDSLIVFANVFLCEPTIIWSSSRWHQGLIYCISKLMLCCSLLKMNSLTISAATILVGHLYAERVNFFGIIVNLQHESSHFVCQFLICT